MILVYCRRIIQKRNAFFSLGFHQSVRQSRMLLPHSFVPDYRTHVLTWMLINDHEARAGLPNCNHLLRSVLLHLPVPRNRAHNLENQRRPVLPGFQDGHDDFPCCFHLVAAHEQCCISFHHIQQQGFICFGFMFIISILITEDHIHRIQDHGLSGAFGLESQADIHLRLNADG